ncbi:MAG: polyprenyl synthetase family protein, partial [Micrococcaceae bacterium]
MSPKRNAAAPEPVSHRDGVEASVAKADFLDAVSTELAQMIQCGVSASGSERMVRMWQRIGRMIEGGKRSRPDLVHLGFRTFGGRSDTPLVKLGCAVELLHTAFVVHDDVIDRDFMRRG